MQDRWNAGYGDFRTGRMQERRDSGEEIWRKAGMQYDRMQDMKKQERSKAKKDGCRTVKTQDWRDADAGHYCTCRTGCRK